MDISLLKSKLLYYSWSIHFRLQQIFHEKRTGAAIVMFHHVGDDVSNDIIDSCKCTNAEFRSFVELIKSNRWVVSFDEMLDKVQQGENNLVVIYFEDVTDNFYLNAYPLLKENKLPFILYVTTGFIDKPGFLSSSQLEILSKDPLCTIGAHTMSHPTLSKKSVNLDVEIRDCKKRIEAIIKKEIRHFAYPFGVPPSINMDVVKYTSLCNQYNTACSTFPGLVYKRSLKSLFILPRIHHKLYIKKFNHK